MELMRSETVGNEQKHANVKVIEHEYQTLTWEQSSFAGPEASLVSRWGPFFPLSGCSVISHIGAGLSVSRITTGT